MLVDPANRVSSVKESEMICVSMCISYPVWPCKAHAKALLHFYILNNLVIHTRKIITPLHVKSVQTIYFSFCPVFWYHLRYHSNSSQRAPLNSRRSLKGERAVRGLRSKNFIAHLGNVFLVIICHRLYTNLCSVYLLQEKKTDNLSQVCHKESLCNNVLAHTVTYMLFILNLLLCLHFIHPHPVCNGWMQLNEKTNRKRVTHFNTDSPL